MPVDQETTIRTIVAKDARYAIPAYDFTLEALSHTIQTRRAGKKKHVSCQELAEGFAEHGAELFGLLAGAVFAQWGIHTARDIGHVVFNMINQDLLQKTADDRLEDFSTTTKVGEMADKIAHEKLLTIAI